MIASCTRCFPPKPERRIKSLARRLCLPPSAGYATGSDISIPQGHDYRTKEERSAFDAGTPVLRIGSDERGD